MKKKILYIMCGRGFSGKSTMSRAIASHTGAVLVSQDAVYWDKKKDLEKGLDENTEWEEILTISKEEVKTALKGGRSVVFDNTNITKAERDEFREIAKAEEAFSIVVFMNTPEEILTARFAKNKDTQERHDVSMRHLEEGKRDFEPPTKEERTIELHPDIPMEDRLKKIDEFVEELSVLSN